MFCQQCGKEIVEGSRFCAGCGAPVNMQFNTVQYTAQVPAGNTVPNVSGNMTQNMGQSMGPNAVGNMTPNAVGNMTPNAAQNMTGNRMPSVSYGRPASQQPAGKKRTLVIAVAAACVFCFLMLVLIFASIGKNSSSKKTAYETCTVDGIEFEVTGMDLNEASSTDTARVYTVSYKKKSAPVWITSVDYSGSASLDDSDLADDLYPQSQGNILSYQEFGTYGGLTWYKSRMMVIGNDNSTSIITVYFGGTEDSSDIHVVELDSQEKKLIQLVDEMVESAEADRIIEGTSENETSQSLEELNAVALEILKETKFAELQEYFQNDDNYIGYSYAYGDHFEESTNTYYIIVWNDTDMLTVEEEMFGSAVLEELEDDVFNYVVIFCDEDRNLYASYDQENGLKTIDNDDISWYGPDSYWGNLMDQD